MDGCYNLRNPAVKRLMKEAEELRNATEEYYAQPLEGNLFEWHFTVRGPPNTDFDGGVYHGRITLPPEYPMKPPSIIILTPNGRFEVNKKICLSISGHHPESWQPSWSIRTALLAIIGFMPTHGNGAIGSLDYCPRERQSLAQRSQVWECLDCGVIQNLIKTSTGLKLCENNEDVDKDKPSSIFSKVKEVNSMSNHKCQDIEENVIMKADLSFTEETSNEKQVKSLPCQVQDNNTTVESENVIVRHRVPFPEQSVNAPVVTEGNNTGVNSANLPSGVFSSTFVWILTLLIIFLLLRRILTHVNCF